MILNLGGPFIKSCVRYPVDQVCAALGMLPGQIDNTILFATSPKSLDPHSDDRPLGKCSGWRPGDVPKGGFAYTNDDSAL